MKKENGKKISITAKLFRSYTLLFLVFYAVTVVSAIVFMAISINSSIINTQMRMAQTISKSVEQYFNDMNDFSLSLMNSSDFKEAVLVDLPDDVRSGSNTSDVLLRLYLPAHEMFEKGYNVGVATNDGYYTWMGSRIIVTPFDRGAVTVYRDYRGYGSPEILFQESNPYLQSSDLNRQENGPVITLARSINLHNYFAKPQAMLEVQAANSDFSKFMDELTNSSGMRGLQICVVSGNGQVLYGCSTDAAFWKAMQPSEQWVKHDGEMLLKRSVFSDKVYVLFDIPIAEYYRRLIIFLAFSLLFSGVICVLLLAVTRSSSRKMTQPIRTLCEQLASIDLSDPVTISKVDTDMIELDMLSSSVTKMNQKLIDSFDDILTLKTAEMQSRLMALQSQMQPHFLYNTLSTINALNEQNDREAITRICRGLSQMLRYVSSKEDDVSIFDEVRFLRNYMDIMQERFPSSELEINIPLEMMQIRVPKLILQPLAENAFKYSGRTDTCITVQGHVSDEQWIIDVTDNGAGFNEEQTDAIKRKTDEVEKDPSALSAKIDGMGLVNIYSRLKLFYREDMLFRISPGSGGKVEIGGLLHGRK
jgi:two-component system sensor histidine kinase YesM